MIVCLIKFTCKIICIIVSLSAHLRVIFTFEKCSSLWGRWQGPKHLVSWPQLSWINVFHVQENKWFVLSNRFACYALAVDFKSNMNLFSCYIFQQRSMLWVGIAQVPSCGRMIWISTDYSTSKMIILYLGFRPVGEATLFDLWCANFMHCLMMFPVTSYNYNNYSNVVPLTL